MLFVRVVELLVLAGLQLSSSNYNLFSKIKAFGDFSESLICMCAQYGRNLIGESP